MNPWEILKRYKALSAALACSDIKAVREMLLSGSYFVIPPARARKASKIARDLKTLHAEAIKAGMQDMMGAFALILSSEAANLSGKSDKIPVKAAAPKMKSAVESVTVPLSLFYGTDRGTEKRSKTNYNGGRGIFASGLVSGVPQGSGQAEISKITPLAAGEFRASVSKALGEAKSADFLVFVHGYNNTFQEGVTRALKLLCGAGFGAASFFSWPSDGELHDYLGDMDDALWCRDDLASFIELAASCSGKVHIIAHSMGAFALSNAIPVLRPEACASIKNLVFAAPDVDRDVFIRNTLPAINHLMPETRVTVYASENDPALGFSSFIRTNGVERLGKATLPVGGADVVDCSEFSGHSHFTENQEILSDIGALCSGGKSALERGLPSKKTSAGVVYRIKKKED